MTALVSVLIPAYNAQESIVDTIESALAQTWPRKEIVIVNDGSTDRTLQIAQRFASKSVLVVTQENQGAAATRNKAFSLCQGDYIQWLDADDLLSLDKIESQMERIGRECNDRSLLSCGWGYFVHRPRSATFMPTALWCDLPPAEWLIRKMSQNLFMQTATWLVSRELTEAAGPWNTRLLGDDDGEYFCRVMLASDGVRFVPEGKVFYRVSGSGRLSYIGRSSRKMEAQFESMRLHIRYLLSIENSDRSRAACVTYLQNWLIDFYPERLDIVAQAEQIAADLGGRLKTPHLSWKYDWIRPLFGWDAAKRAQVFSRQLKASVLRSWDKLLFQVERRNARMTSMMMQR